MTRIIQPRSNIGGRPAQHANGPGKPGPLADRSEEAIGRSDQARWRSTFGRRSAKSRWLGQAARAAARSAPLPVAGRSDSSAYCLAGLGAVAVVLVVGEEPGQVAELGFGPGGPGASAVAVRRTWWAGRRGRRRASPAISAALSGSNFRAASVFSAIWSRFFIETQQVEIRSSDQIAWSSPW